MSLKIEFDMIEKKENYFLSSQGKKLKIKDIKHHLEQYKHGFAHPGCTGTLSAYVA